jgi:glycosyltransferase involved in cell wall biosynthesis
MLSSGWPKMSSDPLISIVTPSYNQGSFIQAALRSVSTQSYPAIEHIVVDGGSNDSTLNVLKRSSSSPRCALRWISEPDRGQSDALNKGFRLAKGDIVGWLNSDDVYRPGCFEHVAKAFRENPNADVIYGDYRWIDAAGKILSLRREMSFSRFVLHYHRVLYIPSTATFFRRRVFDDLNFINTDYHYAMDYEFFLRLVNKGYRFQHLSAVLADFRFQQDSKTCKAAEKQLAEQNRALLEHTPWLRALNDSRQRRALATLRKLAAARRYAEKAARGYYFDQFLVTKIKQRSPQPPQAKSAA